VSFGVAPGVAVYYFLHGIVFRYPEINFIPYFALLIPVFSALRLAKFNIDTRQTASFLGLPVPADALFWAALIPAANFYAAECGFAILIAFPIIIVIFCLLMVSEVPMFSLKFKNYTWTDNKLPYIQIIGTIFLTSVFGVVGISLAIVLYVLLSLMKK
jgi:CDP-diacylglycerol--serine O-phosphatidyltransferase